MKHLLLTLMVIVFASQVMAQQIIKIDDFEESKNTGEEIQTVFKRDKRDGFYGAISVGYSPLNNTDGMVLSARGCWIFDRWFTLGFGGTALTNNINNIDDYIFNNNTDNKAHLMGGYGGFVIEPILAPRKPVHLSFPILIGGGAIALIEEDSNSYPYSQIEDVYFVAEPGIELEVNFSKWLRVAAFATYRYTTDINVANTQKDALRSYSAGITFKAGLF
ncbi:MAG: hypothetical protein PF436_05210 [Prolixibacteraceae bacterium]|jgi:hypothetical protein|nr:hypothetical protein [Prolixibacteraceae bacterium]